jgi:RNA polymerase sigma-70 factor (ECF subfamily)
MLDLAAIYEAHAGEILRYCLARTRDPLVAEDLCSAVFVDLCEHAESYEERGMLRGWLFCMATSRIRDHWRRTAVREQPRPFVVRARTPEERTLDRLWCQEIVAAADLPPRQQVIVFRRYVCEQGPAEIAAALGEPVSAVKAAQHRALTRLRRAADALNCQVL